MRSPIELASAAVRRARDPKTGPLTRELSAHQWWSPDALQRFCDERTLALARHAAACIPYYRELFVALGLDPSRLTIDDWRRLPPLEKDTLRERPESLQDAAALATDGIANATGGSTGKPVRFYSDRRAFARMDAFFHLVQGWAGWKPGEFVLHFWGGKEKPEPDGALSMLKVRLAGRHIYQVYSWDEATFARWWRALQRFRPAIIHTYPSVLAAFAEWLDASGHRPHGVKGVFCSAELMLPQHRAAIERSFGCKVFNQYGSRETPSVACECPEGRMHVFTDLNRVEFLGADGGDLSSQRFVVTPLENFVQPLLRYDLDDRAAPVDGTCPCGRGYPLMSLSLGRNRDSLLALDGRRIYAGFVTRLLDPEPWVKSFQFRQRALDHLELFVQPEDAADGARRARELEQKLLPAVREMMGEGVSLSVHAVETIERTAAGKHRFVINEVDAVT